MNTLKNVKCNLKQKPGYISPKDEKKKKEREREKEGDEERMNTRLQAMGRPGFCHLGRPQSL